MGDITVKNLSFSYGGDERLILKDINMEIEAGEFVCILGQSGCGKSTLLRLLAGLEQPTTGEILMQGVSAEGASLDKGVVFQDYGLFPWMKAGENILLALRQRFPKKDKKELKQIAQALSVDPPILLMDEPFGALDAVTRARLQDMLFDLWSGQASQKTVFFVTHDVDEALLLANRIVVLGQSPSNIIYECKLSDEQRPTRETQFDNLETMKLRNELIRQINKDVVTHIS